MGKSSFEKILQQDWTQRELSRSQARRFANRVVWPAIDLLHTVDIYGEYFEQDDITKFVSLDNLVDQAEIFREETLETSDGGETVFVELLAYCEDDSTNPDRITTVGAIDIDLRLRMLKEEKDHLPVDSELQIWQNKVYFINGSRMYQTISLDTTFALRDYEGKTVQDPPKQLKRMLKSLSANIKDDDHTMRREHCLDIANCLAIAGVPEEFIDERMYGFDQAGNT